MLTDRQYNYNVCINTQIQQLSVDKIHYAHSEKQAVHFRSSLSLLSERKKLYR